MSIQYMPTFSSEKDFNEYFKREKMGRCILRVMLILKI